MAAQARHGIGERGGPILYQALDWRLGGAIPPFVEAIREKVDQYTERSERKLTYECSEVVETQLRALEAAELSGGHGAEVLPPPPPPPVQPPPTQPTVIKSGLLKLKLII